MASSPRQFNFSLDNNIIKDSTDTGTMYRIGARRFSTTVWRAAETVAQMERPNPYGIKVSTAQGIVKGLTGGEKYEQLLNQSCTDDLTSHWKYSADTT
jgi:hypothetical protein